MKTKIVLGAGLLFVGLCVFSQAMALVNDNPWALFRLTGETATGLAADGVKVVADKAKQTPTWQKAEAERTAAATKKAKQDELVDLQTEAAKSQIETNKKMANFAAQGADWFAKDSNIIVINNGRGGATVKGATTRDEEYSTDEEDTIQSEEIVKKAPSVASTRCKKQPRN